MDTLQKRTKLKKIHIVAMNTDILSILWDEMRNHVTRLIDTDSMMLPVSLEVRKEEPTSLISKDKMAPPAFTGAGGMEVEGQTAIPKCKLPLGFQTNNNTQVFIHACDIDKIHIDAIGNITNEILCHTTGIARVISEAAGPLLKKEGREIISTSGPIPLSQTVVTSAGELPCKKVIHAIGASWPTVHDEAKKKYCLKLLRDLYTNIIHTAEKYKFKSLVLCAVTSGENVSISFNNQFKM